MDYKDGPYTAFLLDYIQAETPHQSPTTELDEITHFTNIVERALIPLKRKRNSLLRVHTLPAELLAGVFEWAASGEVRKRYIALQQLRLVCSAWRTVVDTTPVLWSVLSSRLSSRMVDIALERSRNHPLSVWGRLDFWTSSLVAPSVQRWKFASLQFPSPRPLEALRGSAPLLEVLRLRPTNDIDRTSWNEDLLCMEMPQIRELRLQSVSVPWDNRYFPGLRILELSCVRDQGPTIPQLFSVLSQCSKFSRLILDNVVFPPDSTDQTDIQPTMPSLIQLNLTRLASASTNRILTNLNLPTLKRLNLSCSLPRDEPSALFDHRLYLRIPTFVPILQNANTVTIELHLDQFTCRAVFPEQFKTSHSFSSTIRSRSPAGPLRWLCNILNDVAPPLPVELKLSGDFRFKHDHEFLETMFKIPRLVDISFTKPNKDIAVLLARLGACNMDEDGVVKWPLPELRNLRLYAEHFGFSELLAMLQSRYGLTELPQGSENRLPVPFVLLEVVDNDMWGEEEEQEKLEEIVGDDVLRYTYSDEEESEESEESE